MWKGSGGNHTWVEVWSDGKWHYLGAAESTELDQAWFTGKVKGPEVDPTMPQHCIYAASFRRTGVIFPIAWAPGANWNARRRRSTGSRVSWAISPSERRRPSTGSRSNWCFGPPARGS